MDSSLQEMVCFTLPWLKARRRRIAMLMACTTLGVCIYWLYFSGLYQDGLQITVLLLPHPPLTTPVFQMETFSRDSLFILKKAGLEHLLDGHGSKGHSEDEVRVLTDSMFRIYLHRQARLKHCLSLVDLTQRLWQAFVYNGYIDEKLTFPRQEVSDKLQNVHDVMKAYDFARDILIRALRQSPRRTSQELKEYRREVLVKQFRAVSSRILEQILKHYAVDFAMFDYEPRPADIFASSSSDVDTTSTTASVSSRT